MVNGVVCFGNYSATRYALNAAAGALLWNRTVGCCIDTPAVVNGRLYVGTTGTSGKLYVFHLPAG